MNSTLQLERDLQERIPSDVQLTAFIKLYNCAQQFKDIDEDLSTELFASLIDQLDLRGMTLSDLFAQAHTRTY